MRSPCSTVTIAAWAGMMLSGLAQAAAAAGEPPALGVAAIVERNVAARGGLEAWRAVQSIRMSGRMDVGGPNPGLKPFLQARARENGTRLPPPDEGGPDLHRQVQLPVRIELKRPRMSRVEVDFAGKTQLQVYDGKEGWKFRPYLNRSDVEPFNREESDQEAAKAELDGPLIDYAAKGEKIELEGRDEVEGRATYRLKVVSQGGQVQHIWIDAETFLEAKIEGSPRRLDGRERAVSIFPRDYREVQGLVIPFQNETQVAGVRNSEKLSFDHIQVNVALADSRFSKPSIP